MRLIIMRWDYGARRKRSASCLGRLGMDIFFHLIYGVVDQQQSVEDMADDVNGLGLAPRVRLDAGSTIGGMAVQNTNMDAVYIAYDMPYMIFE